MNAMSATLSFRSSVLPWALSHADEARFRRIFTGAVLLSLAFAATLPWLPRPQPEAGKAVPLSAPIARIMLDQPPPPPPLPAARIELPKPLAIDKSEPAPLPTRPVPRERPVAEARNPQPNRPPGEALEAARSRAAGVGLLAMKDQLAELHGAPLAVQLAEVKPGKGVGTGEGVGVGAGKEPGLPDRNMITSNASGGSGGINTSGYSRDTGGGGLAGRATTLVAGVAGGGGGGGFGAGGQLAGSGGHGTGTGAAKAGGSLQKGGSGKASRSLEEVRLVLERAKGSLYAIYNRALREDPTLQGKVVIELAIAPSGAVNNVRFVSSELKSPDLEQKLLARFRLLEFKPEDVDTLITTYPIDFLPSGN
jgi:outer membrane biosynthesis protein TonB